MSLWFADAWGMDIEAGGGYTFGRYARLDESAVVNLNLITQAESILPTEWSLGCVLAQDKNLSDKWNNDQSTLWFGVGKRLRWKSLFLGLGLVAINRTSQRMSSRINFKTEAGLRLGPLVGMVQHISNLGLEGSNDGENLAIFSCRFHMEN